MNLDTIERRTPIVGSFFIVRPQAEKINGRAPNGEDEQNRLP